MDATSITTILEIFLKSETWLAASAAFNFFIAWKSHKAANQVGKARPIAGTNHQQPSSRQLPATITQETNNKPVITTVMETRIQQSEQTAQTLLDLLDGQMEQTKFLQGQLITLQKELQLQRETNLKNNKDKGITYDNNIQT